MRKAIVTGATGFIGKFLTRELVNEQIETIAVIRTGSKNRENISNLPVRVIECDLMDLGRLPDMISDRDIDVVFHAAWQGVSDADIRNEDIQLQNVKATLDLIDAAHEMSIGTFVGCGSIHEAEAETEIANDKVVSNLGYMYKAAKTAAHWMGKAKAGNYGIRFFWPLINTYGEEENSARLINSVIRQIYDGISPKLSSGKQYYDFVHVCDVARAMRLIAEKGVNGTNYCIASGDAKPLREFLEVVGRVANELHGGTDVVLDFGQIVDNVVFLPKEIFDASKLKRDTGFEPVISFEEGIERTAKWILQDWKSVYSSKEGK
ncbi:MAG: NAD-dependent epimerase/dehydratase family protein [Muribaculum sp.]|nr:NAD-dependent epimerase/dehydratase family protein [Muribaculum sp.]